MADQSVGTGPLTGVKVLDLTRVAAGPFATMVLGDLGADVVKVERPGLGDDTRSMDVSYRGGESGYYLGLNKNKRSVVVDLKSEHGLRLVRKLGAWADVVVENFRAGVADRLGLGYDDFKALNDSVVYCSLTGLGPEAEDPATPVYDIVGQAISGIMHITGEADGPPAKCGAPITDIATGAFAVGGIIAALYHRALTGEGQRVEVPLAGSALALLSSYLPGRALGTTFNRVGSAHNTLAPYQAFRGSDGVYFIIGVANQTFWRRILELLGLEPLVEDPRFLTNAERTKHRDELASILQERLDEEPAGTWIKRFADAGIPTSRVYDLDDVLADESYRRNGYIVEAEHSTVGAVPLVMSPIRFSRTPVGLRLPPPLMDEHGDEIRQAFHDVPVSQQ